MRGAWPTAFREDFQALVRGEPRTASYVFDAHTCLAEYSLVGPHGHAPFVDLAAELSSAAREHGSVHGAAIGELFAGEIALFSGHLDEARDRLAAALQLCEEADAGADAVLTQQRMAELDLVAGNGGEARSLLTSILPRAQRTGSSRTSWFERGTAGETARVPRACECPETALVCARKGPFKGAECADRQSRVSGSN